MLKGYADHHVVFAIVQALCTRGMDVMTAADRGQQEADDTEHLPMIAKMLPISAWPPKHGPEQRPLRSIPAGLIPHRSPLPSGSAPEPTPLSLSLARDAKTLRNIAPRAEERPENAPIPGRGPVCLTAHELSSTVPLDEKGH